MTMQVLRYEISVDDQWHSINMLGRIIHVATRRPDVVEMWGLDDDCLATRQFKVFATGEPMPIGLDLCHVGTAIVPGGELVWHLFELIP